MTTIEYFTVVWPQDVASSPNDVSAGTYRLRVSDGDTYKDRLSGRMYTIKDIDADTGECTYTAKTLGGTEQRGHIGELGVLGDIETKEVDGAVKFDGPLVEYRGNTDGSLDGSTQRPYGGASE